MISQAERQLLQERLKADAIYFGSDALHDSEDPRKKAPEVWLAEHRGACLDFWDEPAFRILDDLADWLGYQADAVREAGEVYQNAPDLKERLEMRLHSEEMLLGKAS